MLKSYIEMILRSGGPLWGFTDDNGLLVENGKLQDDDDDA